MPPLLQQRAGNDHHLHFAGALVDLSDLGITHHALDGIVTSVAVAAEQLQAAAGLIACSAGCDQLSLCSLNAVTNLCVAILFSLCFRQAATSALASVAVWLFFSVFYTMIVNLVAKALSPSQLASPYQIVSYQKFILGLMRLAPSELFNEATTTLLMPSVRSLGPLTMEQVQGAIPSPLPLGQSLLVVWPQLTGLIAATVICFALSYVIFMRREVRSR